MTATVTVIGVEGSRIPPGSGAVVAGARLVVGPRAEVHRYMAVARGVPDASWPDRPDPDWPRTIEVTGTAELPSPALDALAESVKAGESAVVLAPGDPGYFGALRTLRAHGLPTVLWPSVSPVQRVASMIQRPWDDLSVVSARDGDLRRAVNVCRARPAVGVLTGPGAGPAELGAALVGWNRTLVVLEGVGTDAEFLSIVDIEQAAARQWREPSVVLCLSDLDTVGSDGWIAGGEPTPPGGGWALDCTAFAHREETSSSAELRAVALAKLAPRPGMLVWDVAAGCGELGIEAARLGAAVIAVESDPGHCLRVVVNARQYGVDVRLAAGELPDVLGGLPAPDSVFLGCSRADVVRACAKAGAGRIVLQVHELGSVGPARDALTDAGYRVDGRLLSVAPIGGLTGGGASVECASSSLLLWGSR